MDNQLFKKKKIKLTHLCLLEIENAQFIFEVNTKWQHSIKEKLKVKVESEKNENLNC